MNIKGKISAFIVATLLVLPVTVSATLIDRGNGLIYDNVLDIKWLQNANQAAGSAFDSGSGATAGFITWDDARAWANDLSYQGFDDWRLASLSVSSGLPTGSSNSVVNCGTVSELQCRDSELGYMFYYNMAGQLFENHLDGVTVDGIRFSNIRSDMYSGTDAIAVPSRARGFNFANGGGVALLKSGIYAAWGVRSGDVLSVPEPVAAALLGLGLAGAIGTN